MGIANAGHYVDIRKDYSSSNSLSGFIKAVRICDGAVGS